MPSFSSLLLSKFPHSPTNDQKSAFKVLQDFFSDEGTENKLLILRGYAGTGKTTMIGSLVKVLPLFNLKFSLLAPTGRAAKVMSTYAKRVAFTIHKRIYKPKGDASSFDIKFKLQKNYSNNTVFIVDEASMLQEDSSSGNFVLSDLISYVYSGENNYLILVGDKAQLPPVGQTESPGLNADLLRNRFRLSLYEVEIREVVRQQLKSGILFNATKLRDELYDQEKSPVFITQGYKDIFKLSTGKLEDGIRYAYDKTGEKNTVIICRSNKSARMYNQYIRRSILFKEEELEAGDLLMIVKNNYGADHAVIPGGFLANGEFAEIKKIKNEEEIHGFRFANVVAMMLDYEKEIELEMKIILDTLHTDTPALSVEQNKSLFQSVLEDYKDLKKKERMEAIRTDPYLNAVQVKFAYALTCHKSQGGQWDIVFIDGNYYPENRTELEYKRWVYTALTRSKKEAYLLNFDPVERE